MRILKHKSLAGRENANEDNRTYLRCAEASLAALKCECDHPGMFLYNALSHLSKIQNSGINIGMYAHLYYSTDKELPAKDLEFAETKLRELSMAMGVV